MIKLGKPLPPVKSIRQPTEDDARRVIAKWDNSIPRKYQGMLDGAYTFDRETRLYISDAGKAITKDALHNLWIEYVDGIDYEAQSEGLKAGTLSLAEWEASIRDSIYDNYLLSSLIAMGGLAVASLVGWGFTADLIKSQYEYLDGFANDIKSSPLTWLSGRLNARANLYRNSVYSSYENTNRNEAAADGYNLERRILGASDHCSDCLDYASVGWQPIGTLPPIGDSICMSNCKCEFEYQKTEMLFAPRDIKPNDMLFSPEVMNG